MQINLDMGQMIQEQSQILQICAEHIECVDCPIKKDKEIKIGNNIWRCENASKI